MKRPHEDLKVWQEAMRLAENVYAFAARLPRNETYGLAAQMRRAAVSIPSNLAEGAARGTTKEFLQFVIIARGSISELETQIELGKRLHSITIPDDLATRLNNVFGLLNGLINSLRRR